MKNEKNEEIIIKIKRVIAQFTDVEIQDIKMESELICDLGFTSFDLVCLLSSIEAEFGIKGDEKMLKGMIKTVGDVSKVILKKT